MVELFKGQVVAMNLEELAVNLGINLVTAREYVKKGMLKAQKVGKRYLVSKKSVEDFLNGRVKVA